MRKILNNVYRLPTICFQYLISRLTKWVLIVFAGLEVRGKDNLENVKDPIIFALNHSSEVDPFVMGTALSPKRMPVYFVMKPMKYYGWRGWRKIFYNDFFLGLIGSKSTVPEVKDYKKSLEKHIQLLRKGYNIGIFPEGRRTSDGYIQRKVRGGISFLSYNTRVPVLPVGISGVFNLSFIDIILKRRKVVVNFGEPVYVWQYLPEKNPSVDELRYVAYLILHYKIKPLAEAPAADFDLASPNVSG